MKLPWSHISQQNTREILLPIIPMQKVLVENSRKIIKYLLQELCRQHLMLIQLKSRIALVKYNLSSLTFKDLY